MLVNTQEMLKKAQREGYAVGAFNVENMEMAMAVISAAEEMKSPVIIQTTPGTIKYASVELYLANVAALAKQVSVPVAMHLDHGNSYELASKAFRAGYTSIMIDGSHEAFDENVAISAKVVEFCKPNNVSVEAELGRVGGKEDDLEVAEGNPYTDPEEARLFVERTNVDSLAIGVGTSHGVYTGPIVVSTQTVADIAKVVSVQLVLHGTSGVPDETVKECVKNGICKVNYATDLRIAFTKGVKEYMAENPNAFDPKKYNALGMKYVSDYVKQKMEVVGSVNKAL